jgi:hypothetical protein
MRNDDDPLLRLGELLFDLNMHPGILATAIEEHGIYTWDRFGRLKHYLAGSPEGERALQFLASFYDMDTDPERREFLDRELVAEVGGDYFCWPASKAPDFARLDTTIQPERMTPPRSAGASAREENADLRVVGALLMYITGDLGVPKHPSYNGNTEFIRHIEKKLDGYPGLKEGTLRKKFDRALGLLDAAGWPADLPKQSPNS